MINRVSSKKQFYGNFIPFPNLVKQNITKPFPNDIQKALRKPIGQRGAGNPPSGACYLVLSGSVGLYLEHQVRSQQKQGGTKRGRMTPRNWKELI